MTGIKKLCAALALAVCSLPAFAENITYTVGASATDQYAWVNDGIFEIGRVSLQRSVADIIDFNTSVTLFDQGWGFQGGGNGLYVGLFEGDNALFGVMVAEADHFVRTENYLLSANPGQWTAFNDALDASARSAPLTVRLYTNAVGYPGWELHTRNASLNLTTGSVSAVPEPATYGMMLAGLGLLTVAYRRRQG